jgi:hypothetical protein
MRKITLRMANSQLKVSQKLQDPLFNLVSDLANLFDRLSLRVLQTLSQLLS